MSLYRVDGNPPFHGAKPPAMIADFEAQCVMGEGPTVAFSIARAATGLRRQ
jgi:hypothetical protein